ncbi:aminotransferase class V-fold PLP-dependent enzyme [Aeromicrobium wangtongii]|uniref:aminotransferase class V-fold PLP-dependent enzyme n=1 Tax=Aeromicrobium wangtongii TaxID=2969247 RepID=UPI002018341F|nr:aminotransferase class V-fold PLP-dependent enzyme [Aeromicrobium wangtongii]MCL3817258.1 aminotransferase class V-fold PLP-dependent enzyme [Aeromicrobium wangtongii]
MIGAIALATAAAELSALPEEAWHEHENRLHRRLAEGVGALPGIDVARIWSDSAAPIGVVTFRLAGTDPALLAAFLAAEHGVSVRDGRFCAHPLLDRLGWGEGAVRASIGVGTTEEDVDRLLAGLTAWVTGDRAGRYELVDGVWIVLDDPRPVPAGLGLDALAAALSPCS